MVCLSVYFNLVNRTFVHDALQAKEHRLMAHREMRSRTEYRRCDMTVSSPNSDIQVRPEHTVSSPLMSLISHVSDMCLTASSTRTAKRDYDSSVR